MSHKAVLDFFESTSNDESLQRELATLIGVGDGDISTVEE